MVYIFKVQREGYFSGTYYLNSKKKILEYNKNEICHYPKAYIKD